jgi:hypothetical protein
MLRSTEISRGMFTICSFNSPDLDGYQGTRENKNVPRETHKGSRNPNTKPPPYVLIKV